LAATTDEARARTETFSYGRAGADQPPHQPHFGVTIVTCAEGDMRATADGVKIYDRDGVREVTLPRGDSMPGRSEVLDDMRLAIRAGDTPIHDGRWGRTTVQIALAILQSAREGREVVLEDA
jgi:phthalate 4,5-cis-dihydrodiol dehydrogenase